MSYDVHVLPDLLSLALVAVVVIALKIAVLSVRRWVARRRHG